MNRTLAYASLFLLTLFAAGCPKRPTAPDYDAVHQRAEQSHQGLDQEKSPQTP